MQKRGLHRISDTPGESQTVRARVRSRGACALKRVIAAAARRRKSAAIKHPPELHGQTVDLPQFRSEWPIKRFCLFLSSLKYTRASTSHSAIFTLTQHLSVTRSRS